MRTTAIAIVSAFVFAQATFAVAQSSSGSGGAAGGGGTAGAGNAAATSGAVGGGTPTQPGIGPGLTNPGNNNVPTSDPVPTPSPTLNPPSPSGGAAQSTAPGSTVGTNRTPASSGTTVGRSGRAAQLKDPKEDPIVRETEQEVSKRIKSICKGC